MLLWQLAQLLLAALASACVAILVRLLLIRRTMFWYGEPALPVGLSASSVEGYLRERDAQVAPLQPEAGSSVSWNGLPQGTQADVVVLFLHGWSASVQEIAPVDLKIAKGLRAPLLRYRLTGHGIAPHERGGEAMRDTATCAALMRDAGVAFGLARRLGKRVVLLGCSTGGTLSLWLSVQPWAAPHIAQLLLIAPCVSAGRPTKQLYRLLRWPFVVLPRALITPALHRITGPTNRIRYKSVRQAACWTLAYPAEAFLNVINVFLTVEVVVDPAKILAPVIVWANPEDRTADYHFTRRWLQAAPAATLVEVDSGEEKHCITGDIQTPSTVEQIANKALDDTCSTLGRRRARW